MMNTPNIWGQGQLFAFSALDGHSPYSDDFVGILSGDKIGVRFFSRVRRELALVGLPKGSSPKFETVTGDVITVNLNATDMNIIYADTHLIVGNTTPPVVPIVLTEGLHNIRKVGDVELQDTLDGDFTAILRRGDRFAFAYGHSEDEAVRLAEKGIESDIEKIRTQRAAIYDRFSLGGENKYALLYSKCISVMKTQLYSPEGRFSRIWSTPNRLPHKRLWLWDSVFHAIGHRHLNASLAEDLILDVIETQNDAGFIPHMSDIYGSSGITQPPIIAWGAYLVYLKSKSKQFLKTVFDRNKAFLDWCYANRRNGDCSLLTWCTEKDENCRCDECGMDNSPRFDKKTRLEAIDFSCFFANELRYMSRIAGELGDEEGERYYAEWFDVLRSDINRKLWSEEDGFYFDYDLSDFRHHKIWSVASFLPLFVGICDDRKAALLVEQLENEETFNTPFSIPSIARNDTTFGTDMWRGPVWLNYNYMIACGLEDYGYADTAKKILEKTIEVVNEWYLRTGVVFEFYDPMNVRCPSELNRKGAPCVPYDFRVKMQAVRDYGWTATICMDILHRMFVEEK